MPKNGLPYSDPALHGVSGSSGFIFYTSFLFMPASFHLIQATLARHNKFFITPPLLAPRPSPKKRLIYETTTKEHENGECAWSNDHFYFLCLFFSLSKRVPWYLSSVGLFILGDCLMAFSAYDQIPFHPNDFWIRTPLRDT